jgi:hypothetical protein
MYVALGFCTAGLICLAILPAFYRRAARLTEEALRAVNPTSYAEVRAAQDQVRAQHAVDLRRVERQLDSEREKSVERHIEVSRLKAKIDALKQAHQAELSEFKAEIAAKTSDAEAVDLLSDEVATLKQKLADAEQALADSWSKDQSKQTATGQTEEEDSTDWLPATDTMALATITGLEAEVATLKAKLARYEPSVAGELDNERTETARSRLAELEAQLVDTESKFVTAQAEVTRLSLQLEASDIKDSDLQKRLTEQLQALAIENAQHLSQLKSKERSIERLTGQVEKLQQDLAATSTLNEVRQDFRNLVAQLSGEPAKTKTSAAKSIATAAGSTAAGPDDMKPKRRARQSSPRAKKLQAEEENMEKSNDSSSTANIASAAEALVSRIVASNRKNNSAPPQTDQGTDDKTNVAPVKEPEGPSKARASKQKSKDVA